MTAKIKTFVEFVGIMIMIGVAGIAMACAPAAVGYVVRFIMRA